MNEILAGIYGTGGHEKVASANGEAVNNLSDLALLILAEANMPSDNLEKIAEAHDSVLNDLVSFDRAGRAMAHYEFSQMEKEASEGNEEALAAFFGDVQVEQKPSEADAVRQAVLAELQRRLSR